MEKGFALSCKILFSKILLCSYKDGALTSWQHSSYIRTNSGKYLRSVEYAGIRMDNLYNTKTPN